MRAKRVTSEISEVMGKIGIPDWGEEAYRCKWRWLGHICRRNDDRWTRKILGFEPDDGYRKPGHPVQRWEDSILKFTNDHLNAHGTSNIGLHTLAALAQNREFWKQCEEDFVKYCCNSIERDVFVL